MHIRACVQTWGPLLSIAHGAIIDSTTSRMERYRLVGRYAVAEFRVQEKVFALLECMHLRVVLRIVYGVKPYLSLWVVLRFVLRVNCPINYGLAHIWR